MKITVCSIISRLSSASAACGDTKPRVWEKDGHCYHDAISNNVHTCHVYVVLDSSEHSPVSQHIKGQRKQITLCQDVHSTNFWSSHHRDHGIDTSQAWIPRTSPHFASCQLGVHPIGPDWGTTPRCDGWAPQIFGEARVSMLVYMTHGVSI